MRKEINSAAAVFVLGLCCAAQVSITSNRYDSNRSATNLAETTLTASNVNSSSFGKLWSYAVEGPIFAQPLYVPGVTIAGKTHNVLYVATMHDLLYAFDADSAGSPLWKRNLTDGAAPADASAYAPVLVPGGADNELGVLSTPVIDTATSTMYAVAAPSESGANVYRLHALDIRTGKDTHAAPIITATVAG